MTNVTLVKLVSILASVAGAVAAMIQYAVVKGSAN